MTRINPINPERYIGTITQATASYVHVNLPNAAAVPVGLSCRTCERIDCQARAFPALQHSATIDENVRGVSFYSPVAD